MSKKIDPLKDLFSRMPETDLPTTFRQQMMQQIRAEAERARKRNERWGWVAVIAASLLMTGIAISSFIYMEIQPITLSTAGLSLLSFYVQIGIGALILLLADYKFRKRFEQRQMPGKENS